jgi:hypothetical protein
MLYSILIYVPEDLVDAMSTQDMDAHIAKHLRVHDQLDSQGRLGPVVRLMPTTTAVQLRTTSTPHVIDGPFAETKEQLLGFYVVDCATQEEALEAARLIGGACTSRALEVRPISWFQLTDSIDHSKASVRVEPKP